MNQYSMWLGSQDTYDRWEEAKDKISSKLLADSGGESDSSEVAKLYTVQNGVAIIEIAGSLVDGRVGYWGKYFGALGYLDIRESLVEAVKDPAVTSILLNASSGGGDVAGCHETAQLIRRVDKVKPVITFVSSKMGSACTWLCASARQVYTSETAICGSIGVILIHMSKEKMLKDEGVAVTVIRAGTDKALATPYEDLTTKAKDSLQALADGMYDIFLPYVADCRGVSVEVADAKFGQGKEFLGKAAVEAGLVDKVGTFEDALIKAQSLGAKKSSKTAQSKVNFGVSYTNTQQTASSCGTTALITTYNSTNLESKPMPQSLTDEELVAMAAGISPEPVAEAVIPVAEVPPVITAETQAQATPDAITVVKEMLASAQNDLMTVRAEAMTAKSKLEELTAQSSAFVDIARNSVKTMGLHFGLKSESVAAMHPSEVLSEHTRLASMFQEKFKAGRVAATAAKAEGTKSLVPFAFSAVTKK